MPGRANRPVSGSMDGDTQTASTPSSAASRQSGSTSSAVASGSQQGVVDHGGEGGPVERTAAADLVVGRSHARILP